MSPTSLVDNLKPRQIIAPVIEWFGHSKVLGTGILADADTFRGIVSREIASASVNRGVGGQKLADSVATPGFGTVFLNNDAIKRNRTSPPFIGPDRAYATLWGINEVDGNTPAGHFARCARVAISRLRTCTVCEHTDSSVTLTGTWTTRAVTLNRASNGDYTGSSTAGDRVDINLDTKYGAGQFPGGIVGIGFTFKNGVSGIPDNAGDWTVQHNAGAGFVNAPRADGGTAGVWNDRAITDAPTIAASICADVGRFVIPAGATAIRITLAAVMGEAGFDYWQLEAPTSPPKVLWGLCPRIGNYSVAVGTPTKTLGDQRVTAQNAAVRALVAAEFTDGRVALADVDAAWDATYSATNLEEQSATGQDLLHPSHLGSRAAAMAYLIAAGVRTPHLLGSAAAPTPKAAPVKIASVLVAASARYVSASAGFDLHRVIPGGGTASSGQPVFAGRVRGAVQADKTGGKLFIEFNDAPDLSNPWFRVYETLTPASTETAGTNAAAAVRTVDTFVFDVPIYARWFRIGFVAGPDAAGTNIVQWFMPVNV